MLPARWPRLLDRKDAAEYCGVSVNHFLEHVPVSPMKLGEKKLWDRRAIDEWLDGGSSGRDTTSTKEWLDRA